MATQNYQRPFSFNMADGSVRTFKRGEQEDVPDEVANSPYAQSFLVDAVLLTPQVFGTLGHEVRNFEDRDMSDEEDAFALANDAALAVPPAFSQDAEIAEPDGKGMSTRVPSSRPRVSASD